MTPRTNYKLYLELGMLKEATTELYKESEWLSFWLFKRAVVYMEMSIKAGHCTDKMLWKKNKTALTWKARYDRIIRVGIKAETRRMRRFEKVKDINNGLLYNSYNHRR